MIAAAIVSANHFEVFILPSHTPRAAEMLQNLARASSGKALFRFPACIGTMNHDSVLLLLVILLLLSSIKSRIKSTSKKSSAESAGGVNGKPSFDFSHGP